MDSLAFLKDYPIAQICFWASTALMVLVAFVDLKSSKVPTIPVILIAVMGFVVQYLNKANLLYVVGIAAAVGAILFVLAKLFEVIKLQPVLGYGDVQLFVAAVLWLTIPQLPTFFILTGVLGLVIALLYLKKQYFPFAPAIAVAWFIVVFTKKTLINFNF